MKIILLADRSDVGVRRLAAALFAGGLEVEVVAHPNEAEHTASVRGADAIVFDPEVADLDLLHTVPGRQSVHAYVAWTPGFSSARAAKLIDAGANEVLHGGMSAEELIARLRNVVRRAGRDASGALELGRLRIDAEEGEVAWDEKEIRLSRREREVLLVLAGSVGRTVRREQLYRRVWGYTMARGDRTVDVNVKRLRDKLAAAGAGAVIETRPGIGYKLDLIKDEPARRSQAAVPAADARPAA